MARSSKSSRSKSRTKVNRPSKGHIIALPTKAAPVRTSMGYGKRSTAALSGNWPKGARLGSGPV
jgi:hypothetical protein